MIKYCKKKKICMVTSNQLTYLESDEVTEHEVLHTSRPFGLKQSSGKRRFTMSSLYHALQAISRIVKKKRELQLFLLPILNPKDRHNHASSQCSMVSKHAGFLECCSSRNIAFRINHCGLTFLHFS